MTIKNTSFSPTRRDHLIAVAIVLFAFVLRCIVVFERAYHDPAFFDMPDGSDQQVYLYFTRLLEAGQWPAADEPYLYQPGLVYLFGFLRLFIGDSLPLLRLALCLFGALAVGCVIGAGWLIAGKRWGGYLAGGLLAGYPVAIFYAGEPLDSNISLFLISAFVLLVLWQREKRSVLRTALIGLLIGAMVITRLNLALVAGAWLLYLVLLRPSLGGFVLHTMLTVIAAALIVAPITLHNIQAGKFLLVSDAGSKELYRGNNRDSSGIRAASSLATALVPHEDYVPTLLFDIGRDPRRFIELQLRKIGLFLSPSEPANNIDYATNGEDASMLLRMIPLDFRLLLLVGLPGIAALVFKDRRDFVLLIALLVLMLIGILLLWYAARLRLPAVLPLILGTAYLLIDLAEKVRWAAWVQIARRYAPSLLAAVLLCAAGDWAIDHLPNKTTLNALPDDAIPTEIIFDETLRLVGWRALLIWPSALTGWSAAGEDYAVELFWQIDQPTTHAYNASIAYVINGERVVGYDWEIGNITYPQTPTSTWQQGAILSEIVGFSITRDLPREISGDLRISVYHVEGEFRPGEPDTRQVFPVVITSLPDQPTSIALHALAVVDYPQPPADRALPENYTASQAVFGEQIALLGYAYQVVDDELHLAFQWATLPEVEIRRDVVQFVHIEDSTGIVVAQLDVPPRAGGFLTSTWPPDYDIDDQLIVSILSLSTSTGPYRVYTGLYDSVTIERLPVNAPDNRLLLFEFSR